MLTREFFLSLCDTRICSYFLGEDEFLAQKGGVFLFLTTLLKDRKATL